MNANLELIWFLPVVTSFLWMWGGTNWKPARRFILPLVVFLALLYFAGFSWWFVAVPIILIIATILPFTLIGGSVFLRSIQKEIDELKKENDPQKEWDIWMLENKPELSRILNSVWIFIIPLIISTHTIFIAIATNTWSGVGYCFLITIFGIGIPTILSNLKPTRKYFPWKMCEMFFGFVTGFSTPLLLDLFR